MPKIIKVLGASQESLEGPGTITHEGGDPILIAEVTSGLPGTEHTLVYEGEEVVIDGDDEFQPASEKDRSVEVGAMSLIRALGQANYSFAGKTAPKKKEAEKIAA